MNDITNQTQNIETPIKDKPILNVIPAGKWLRLFNFLVDYVVVMVIGLMVGLYVSFFFGLVGQQFLESNAGTVLGLLIYLGYYLLCESLTGKTLGKLITGTKVVNVNGEEASYKQILGRSFARFIPFEFLTFLGEEGRGWHDSLPKTYVVKYR